MAMESRLAIVEVSKLREHERVDTEHLEELKSEIAGDGFLKNPIVVDRNTNIILDGHHRFNVIKSLGYSKIPVQYVDYNNPEIIVEAWREERRQTKESVVRKAMRGEKFPPKTTRHIIPNRVEGVMVSLNRLK
ncbi:hypothetical protein A3K63_02620 [Candidatus Micrarchaeota archaeon RBG_16_49_10]|nr:MAG: hypothetical protein A3K63_02620 [Candidatus Micrarchaeota archaeon RBG_16_49_10]